MFKIFLAGVMVGLFSYIVDQIVNMPHEIVFFLLMLAGVLLIWDWPRDE